MTRAMDENPDLRGSAKYDIPTAAGAAAVLKVFTHYVSASSSPSHTFVFRP